MLDKDLEIRKAINNLSLQEAKQFITLIKLQLDLAERSERANIDLYNNVKKLYENLLVSNQRPSIWEPNEAAEKVHIVFGDSLAGSLKYAIRQLGLEETNKMINVRDLFSIGPLWQLHEEVGRAHRIEWFRDHINMEDDLEDYDSCHRRILEQKKLIPPKASIVIWSGKNAHEQAGLRYAVFLLRNCQNEIIVFQPDEACGQHRTYLHSGEIPPEQLQKVFGEINDSRPLDRETRMALEREWQSLANQHHVLRIWDGEKIRNVDETYFDAYLLKTIENLHADNENYDFMKAARVIGEALGHCDQTVGDSYFEYRLRQLIYNGALEIKGVPRSMRNYSVRMRNTPLR